MSFRWTFVRESEDAALARGDPPPDFLSERERAILSTLTFERRRRKWLLGRWAAKRVLAEALAGPGGTLPPSSITVDNDPAGAPFATLPDGSRVPWCLSISHRAGVALAVLASEPGIAIGADIETVTPRAPALVGDFFVEREQALVAAAPPGDGRDRLVARIWSAKESVLKALGVGLRLDTRTIEVGGEGGAPWPSVPAGFRPLVVRLLGEGPPILAVTRDEGELVLTVARLAVIGR